MPVSSSKIVLLRTQEYFNKISSVATDIKDKESVFKFVEGIFDLGLWDNMICWPLRSSQNAGVGNTVYSLGGLGTYNGTLVNGPTWGVDGMLLSSTSKITTSLAGWGAAPQSMFGVIKTNSDSNSGDINFAGSDDFNSRSFSVGAPLGSKSRGLWTVRNGVTTCNYIGDSEIPLNSFCGFSVSQNSTNLANFFINDQLISSSSLLPWDGGISGGNMNLIQALSISATVYVPLVVLFPNTSLTGNHSNVYSLYKQTLGQGLGLP